MIICKSLNAPDDHLQEARSSRWSFASRWILRMIICKRGARGVRVGGCYRTKINFLMFLKWILKSKYEQQTIALKILAPCGTRQKYLQNDKKHISDKVTLQSATKASFPSSSGVAGRLDTKPVDHTSYGNKNENHICLIFPHPDHCHITNIVIFIITTRSPNWNCDRGFHLYTCWSQTPTTHQRKLLHRRFHQFSAITWF